MKNPAILLVLIISIPISLASCLNSIRGNGNVQEDIRKVKDFSKVSISGSYEVYVRQGEHCQLRIETDENLMDYIKAENKGEWLKIWTKEPIAKATVLKLYITAVDLDAIDISGAVALKSKSAIRSKTFDLELSGAGEIDLELDVNELNLDLSGGTESTLKGKAEKLTADISGAGSLDAEELETDFCNIDISGAGDASLFVNEELDVDISGAGSVKYKGNPSVKKDVSGAGSIVSID